MAEKEIESLLMDASDSDVWVTFALSSKELKRRGLVRTRNFTGERGEFLAIRTYKDIPGLPNLQAAPEGAQNVDAISRKGDRYSIKTITEPGKATGVFYGCGNKDDDIVADKKFEYVIIVIINDDYKLMRMYEINWNQFLEIRKWHATMRAWYLSINKNLIDLAKVIV